MSINSRCTIENYQKMYWNYGGNFKPVATACQYSDWTKCLISFIRYIWFEVVTDVADCLANEEVLWRVLAILLTSATIVYFVYWKLQWKRELQRNIEKFTVVNHKIKDLELKVDIITYKTQYGIWPLQYLQENNALANLKNFPLGFSKFTLENSWIKNILARDNEKKYFLEKYSDMQRNMVQKYSSMDECNFLPSDYDNKLLSNSEKPMQYLDSSRINSLVVPPESNLNDRSKNKFLYVKENVGTRNNNFSHRKATNLDNAASIENRIASDKGMKKVFSEFQGKTPNIPNKNYQYLSKSHDTLLDVQERLESLYKTINNYTTNNPVVPMLKLDSDSKDVHISEDVPYTMNDSTENTSTIKNWKNITQFNVEYSNSASDAIESGNKGNHANYNGTEKSCDQSSKFNPENDKNAEDFDNQKNEMDTHHGIMELHLKPIDSASTLHDETAPALDDLTSALLQEALKFKRQILSKVDPGIDVKEECTSSCTESNSETSLKPDNLTFESKILDMITEESSVSSYTKRKSDFIDYKIVDKNKISPDKTVPSNEKNKRSCLKNTSSNVETLVEKKVKKQKDLNCLSKVNNKSFNSESSSNRIFPSSISTVFLCNEQDGSNLSKQTHDNDTTVETKSSQDLISLTESSSDVSVNRLISKLIKNERKLKKPNQLTESEKTTMNGSTVNSKESNDAEITIPLIELTQPIIYCGDPLEDTKCNDTLHADTSKIECLKKIKFVPKKLKESVLDIKESEEHNPILKTKFQNPEIKVMDKKEINNSSIDQHGTYDDMLHMSKESDETVDSMTFSDAQKLACNKKWKPSRAKSNLDLTAVGKHQLKLTHRRSKSYVNLRELTDESSTCSSQLSAIKVFDKGNSNNVNRSSELLCSTSSFIPISKTILLKDEQISPVMTVKKDCIKKESSLELIPLNRHSSSKSCIPVMNNRMAAKMTSGKHLLGNQVESPIKNLLQNKTGDMTDQADTDTDEICSLSISEEKDLSENVSNFSGFDSFKNVAQNAIIYYNLVSEDRHVSNDMTQSDSSDMPIQEITSTITKSLNGSITCVLSDELSELNSLNSIIFQNSIPSISPYQIERKETEVLVKPCTLDISTSMTNFPYAYQFDEGNPMNDLKIFEISDELTKEECIRYLQMIDEDSNCDQSTNIHNFCNKLL